MTNNRPNVEKVEKLFWEWWKPDSKEMKEDGEKFIKSLRELNVK